MSAVKPVPYGLPPGSEASLPAETRRVVEAAQRAELPFRLRILDAPAASTEALAAELGCEIDFIAITRVFKAKATRKPMLLVASARTIINERQLATLFGEVLERADADFVRRATGYPIEAVPPLGLVNRLPTQIDSQLTRCQEIWCAAGTPETLIQLPTRELARATAARIIRLS